MEKKLFYICLALLSFSCNNSDTYNSNVFKQHDSNTQNTDSNIFYLGADKRINTKQPKISLKKMSVHDNFLSIYLPTDFESINIKRETIPYFEKQDCLEKYGNRDTSVSFGIYTTKKKMTEDELDAFVIETDDMLRFKNERISDVTIGDASFDKFTVRTIGFYSWVNDNYVYYRMGFTSFKNSLVMFLFIDKEKEIEYAEQTAEMIFRSIKLK